MLYGDINEILERTNIQKINTFILTGGETVINEKSYEERINEASELILNRLKSIYHDEFHEAFDEFNQAIGAYEFVCTEIGLKIGARLMLQLLSQ